jgi:hypothetical protein
VNLALIAIQVTIVDADVKSVAAIPQLQSENDVQNDDDELFSLPTQQARVTVSCVDRCMREVTAGCSCSCMTADDKRILVKRNKPSRANIHRGL